MTYRFSPLPECALGGAMQDEKLRLKAEQCLVQATAASDERSKALFLQMAEAWLRLASHKERIAATMRSMAGDATVPSNDGHREPTGPQIECDRTMNRGERRAVIRPQIKAEELRRRSDGQELKAG